MTLKEKLKKTSVDIVIMSSIFIVLQFASLFITFHMFKALKKIDPNLSFFQKISQAFQTIFSKQGMFGSKLSIGLNVVFALLALASFIFTCYCIYNGIFDKNNEINKKISESLQLILFSSLPFLFVIPIGFVNPDLMKFGMIAFAVFAFSRIIMENIMIGFDFSGLNLRGNDLFNTYKKIDEIKDLLVMTETETIRSATKGKKLQAIFFEVILCFPSFAVEFLIETICKPQKFFELAKDGISELKDLICGKKLELHA